MKQVSSLKSFLRDELKEANSKGRLSCSSWVSIPVNSKDTEIKSQKDYLQPDVGDIKQIKMSVGC